MARPALLALGTQGACNRYGCAWIEGNGDKNIKELTAIDEADLSKIYQNANFSRRSRWIRSNLC
jgi:hypothetical protein